MVRLHVEERVSAVWCVVHTCTSPVQFAAFKSPVQRQCYLSVVLRHYPLKQSQVQNCFVPDKDLSGRNIVPLQLVHLLLRECSLSLLINESTHCWQRKVVYAVLLITPTTHFFTPFFILLFPYPFSPLSCPLSQLVLPPSAPLLTIQFTAITRQCTVTAVS